MTHGYKDGAADGKEDTGTFTISLHGSDSGRLLREYSFEGAADDLHSLEDVERQARSKLAPGNCDEVVVVITAETLTSFRQVQLKIQP